MIVQKNLSGIFFINYRYTFNLFFSKFSCAIGLTIEKLIVIVFYQLQVGFFMIFFPFYILKPPNCHKVLYGFN